MKYTFHAFGHENILGTHRNTLEFTKDKSLTKNGDCIIGIDSDFDTSEIRKLISSSKNGKMKLTVKWKNEAEEVSFDANKDFSGNHEIVIRKTGFLSGRTLGINADRSSFELNRDLMNFLKLKNSKITIILEN